MKRYLAFISYRHRDPDQQASAFLRKKLEGYHLPKDCQLPRRRKVFRDTDELPTSTDLGQDIENALEDSEYLIALCSEEYMLSRWCMREIELYLGMGRKDRILPVLVSGTPETAIPESIRDIPVAADVRSGRRGELEAAVPALLSRMTGLDADDFASRERRFRFSAGAGIVAAVTAAVFGFAAYSMHTAALIEQGNRQVLEAAEQAEKARNEAIEQRNNALMKSADYLAEKAYSAIAADERKEAVRLALSALPDDLNGDEPVSAEATGALRLAMSLPTNSYELASSLETDYEITGYRAVYSNLLFLEGIPDPGYRSALVYETGEIVQTTDDRENPLRMTWERAAASGASGSMTITDLAVQASEWKEVRFGTDRPMQIRSTSAKSGETLETMTLNGEPYYADHVMQSAFGGYLLAWLENPDPGQEQHTALFKANETEALAELQITGSPVSAEFAPRLSDRYELAVVDEAGVIRLYQYPTGELIRCLPGTWSMIHYPDGVATNGDFHRVCAVPADGTGFRVISTVTGEPSLTVSTPSRIRSLSACSEKRMLLTLCEDGIYIYNLANGKLMGQIRPDETPKFAIWGQRQEGMRNEDGNMIVLLYPQRVEVYRQTARIDTTVSDAVPLYWPGATQKIETICYSPDGRRLFIQNRDDVISAWDALTGQFLWVNDTYTKKTEAVIDISVSEDGRAVWRGNAVSGVERIDAATGEDLYTVGVHAFRPVESPDGQVGIAWAGGWSNGVRSPLLTGFDLESGEILWEETEYSGNPAFTEDGSILCCVNLRAGAGAPSYDAVCRRLDPKTGKILEENTVLHLAEGQDYENTPKVLINRQKITAAVYCSGSDERRQACFRVWIINLENGAVIRTDTLQGTERTLQLSSKGQYVVSWADEDDYNIKHCLELDPDKGPGEEQNTRTETGRRLMMTQYQEVWFAGEEGCLNDVQSIPESDYGLCTPTKLYRLSDHALLLNGDPYRMIDNNSPYEMKIAGSPAGGSLCVYSTDTTPVLILDSDTDTLVEKARKYMEGQQ